MRDPGAKLIKYIQSGFHIKSCSRSRSKRVLQFEAPIFSFYRPRLKLTDTEYQKAMRRLIRWLVESHRDGDAVEIQTSHYGAEWVELRNPQGKLRSRLALSVRTIDSLKSALFDAATRQDGQASTEAGPGPTGSAYAPEQETAVPDGEFPRVLPRRPAIAQKDVPEKWRSAKAVDPNTS